MLLDQRGQRGGVAQREFIHHGVIGDSGRLDHHLLQVFRQCLPGLEIDGAFEDGGRLVPGRRVVILGHLMQAEGQIIVGADPVGGIDHAGFHRGEYLAARQIDRAGADAIHHFARQPRQADLQALHVLETVHFLVEPAGHLGAGVAHRQRLEVVARVDLVPQLHAIAVIQPGVGLGGVHAEGHGGEELGRGHLALPVVGGRVAHLGGTGGHGIEDFQRRYHLAGAIDLDLQATTRELTDQAGEFIGTGAQCREVLRPGGDHLPVDGLALGGIGGGHERRGGETGSTGPQSREKTAALHGTFLVRVVGNA